VNENKGWAIGFVGLGLYWGKGLMGRKRITLGGLIILLIDLVSFSNHHHYCVIQNPKLISESSDVRDPRSFDSNIDFKSPDVRDPKLFGSNVDFKSPDVYDPKLFDS
jgi:hypothetical protein